MDLEKGDTDIISIHNGLQNKTVLCMNFDRKNNLWLGLDNGIDCIRLSSPVYSLYGSKPVIGSGYSSCRYGDKLYLGTNQGLYRTVLPEGRSKEAAMEFCLRRAARFGRSCVTTTSCFVLRTMGFM